MKLKKITAIIRASSLDAVETQLRSLGVPGLTVTRVTGFGEYANYFSKNWKTTHARIELFVDAEQTTSVVDAIVDAAHTGTAGDGIVVVLPVDSMHRIRDGRIQDSDHTCECDPAECNHPDHDHSTTQHKGGS